MDNNPFYGCILFKYFIIIILLCCVFSFHSFFIEIKVVFFFYLNPPFLHLDLKFSLKASECTFLKSLSNVFFFVHLLSKSIQLPYNYF